jgi:hypothetical protein
MWRHGIFIQLLNPTVFTLVAFLLAIATQLWLRTISLQMTLQAAISTFKMGTIVSHMTWSVAKSTNHI